LDADIDAFLLADKARDTAAHCSAHSDVTRDWIQQYYFEYMFGGSYFALPVLTYGTEFSLFADNRTKHLKG
jgi:hypothetical protein